MDRRTFLAGAGGLLAVTATAEQLLHAAPATAKPAGEDWPQYRGPKRDGTWRETGLLEKFSAPEVPIKWRTPISHGYAGPTVADGRVFLTDRLTEPDQQERVRCFDAETGKELWSHAYPCVYKGVSFPDGPRACVTVNQGRAYTVGAMGHVHCFDAATGKLLWAHNGETEYRIKLPGWGVTADPYVEGDKVIVQLGGTDGACVVAFDRVTGKEKWRALNDDAGYSAPVLVTQGGKRVAVVWTLARVAGLDVETGKQLWDFPIVSPSGIGDAIQSPSVHGEYLFVSGWFVGAYMLRLRQDMPAVEPMWARRGQNERNTEAMHLLFSPPLWDNDHIFGIDTYGELRCLDIKTGDRVWENQTLVPRARSASVHMTRQGDRIWAFNERGELVIGKLTAKGFEEASRAALIKPTTGQFNQRGGVVWSPPAFAYRSVFVRNDEELVCASLAAG